MNHDKDNFVVDALCFYNMGSVSHVEEAKKDLVKDVHRFAILAVRLKESRKGDLKVHHNSKSSLVVEMKSKQHNDKRFMDLN